MKLRTPAAAQPPGSLLFRLLPLNTSERWLLVALFAEVVLFSSVAREFFGWP